MKHYSTYLFDADGTLLDTTELIYRSFLNTCRIHGDFIIERETVYQDIGIPLITQLKKHLGKRTDEEYEEILETHRSYQKEIFQETLTLYTGIKEGLQSLKERGAKLGIVSSRTRESLDRYLKHTEIFDFFPVISTPEVTANHKPHPEPVLWALEKLDSSPDETLFIGDAIFDIQSGRDAGVDTALVTWGHNDPHDIPVKPTWFLESMNQLLV